MAAFLIFLSFIFALAVFIVVHVVMDAWPDYPSSEWVVITDWTAGIVAVAVFGGLVWWIL